MCPEEEFYVNPTGRFVVGGPDGDCGLTGVRLSWTPTGGARSSWRRSFFR